MQKIIVIGCPGSGKTTVLLCRILRLLERKLARPTQILALTFSKAAAEEMKERFKRARGPEGVAFGTFHSVFFRILRSRYGWSVEQVFQEEERRTVLRNILEEAKWDIPDLEEYISDDELVEITPKSIRLRKKILNNKERERAARK